MSSWKQLDRKTLVDTKFLKVYQDTVELPSGQIFDDYTVVKKNDIVVIVATDVEGQLIAFKEYKYAANDWLLTLPAGQIDGDETPEQAGARELLEETGYGAGEVEYIDTLVEYPTKDLHKITVVRARNVSLQKEVAHEATENIGAIQLLSMSDVRDLIARREWKITTALAALTVALPELYK